MRARQSCAGLATFRCADLLPLYIIPSAKSTRRVNPRILMPRAGFGGNRLFARRSGLSSTVEALADLGLRVSASVSGVLVLLVLAFVPLEALPTPSKRTPKAGRTTNKAPRSCGKEAIGRAAQALVEREAGQAEVGQRNRFPSWISSGRVGNPLRGLRNSDSSP